jgi:prevent-host-death family protein
MKRVGIAELKSHLSEHLRSAEAGETIEVMDRARPIAKVVPFDADAGGLELIPASRSFASVRRVRLAPAKLAMTSLEALQHDRGSR